MSQVKHTELFNYSEDLFPDPEPADDVDEADVHHDLDVDAVHLCSSAVY